MDQDSIEVYRKLGYTHAVPVISPDPRQPNGYKAVKKHPDRDVFIDENGFEYAEAEEFPPAEEEPEKPAAGSKRSRKIFNK